MGKDLSANPKATLTLKSLSHKDAVLAGTATLKLKKGDFTGSLQASDKTVGGVKTLKDVVATVDYKVPQVKGVTANVKYEAGPKVYTGGLTWDGKVADKAVTQKLTFSSKDQKLAGDLTVTVVKGQKANVVFRQDKLTSCKYSLTNSGFTYEPSYNFDKKAPAVAVTRAQGKDTFKVSYDLKSEAAALEWNRKPLKVTVASTISKSGSVGKPTVTAVFDNVYSF